MSGEFLYRPEHEVLVGRAYDMVESLPRSQQEIVYPQVEACIMEMNDAIALGMDTIERRARVRLRELIEHYQETYRQ